MITTFPRVGWVNFIPTVAFAFIVAFYSAGLTGARRQRGQSGMAPGGLQYLFCIAVYAEMFRLHLGR